MKRHSLSSADPSTIVLLIDHNDTDRTSYAERIRIGLPDCLVLEAHDGHSGLELYKSQNVDCIVTELNLPDMSGFELLVEVVPQASQPQVAVIMLSRVAFKPLTDLAQTYGAQAFLSKRLMFDDELVQTIRQAMATVGPRKDRRGE